MNLRGLIVQSSNLFGISSVQFSSLGISLLESWFSSVRGTGAKCLRSVRSVQFIQFRSRTLPALNPTSPFPPKKKRKVSSHCTPSEEDRQQCPAYRPGVVYDGKVRFSLSLLGRLRLDEAGGLSQVIIFQLLLESLVCGLGKHALFFEDGEHSHWLTHRG